MNNFTSTNLRRPLAALLLAEVAAVLIPFFLLGKYFNFPDILRQPAAQAFTLFRQNSSVIVPAYYVFLVSALLYVPMAVLLKAHLQRQATSSVWLELMQVSAVATAIFQAIGFSRWIFAMPFLTERYTMGTSTESVDLLYEWSNRFVGTTVGEHLGFLAMGFWMVALSMSLTHRRILSVSGLIIGLLLMASTLEHFGGSTASIFALINLVANVMWSLWMIRFAVDVLTSREPKMIVPARPVQETVAEF